MAAADYRLMTEATGQRIAIALENLAGFGAYLTTSDVVNNLLIDDATKVASQAEAYALNEAITAYSFGSITKAQLENGINSELSGKSNGYYKFVIVNISAASTPFGTTNYAGWISVNASSRYTVMLFEQSSYTVIRGNYNGTTWSWDKLVVASEIPNNTYDLSVSISSGSNYSSMSTGLSAAQIRSIEVIYNDDFYYNPCAVALSSDTGNINVKLFSNATADRTYVIRVYHI